MFCVYLLLVGHTTVSGVGAEQFEFAETSVWRSNPGVSVGSALNYV